MSVQLACQEQQRVRGASKGLIRKGFGWGGKNSVGLAAEVVC